MAVIGKIVKKLMYAAVSILLVYMLWLLSRAFLFDQFVIPTDSMNPTLLPGDRVIVDKTIMGARIYSDFEFNPKGGELHSWRTRGLRSLKHNDIVVFNFPHHNWCISFVINNVYCKRIMALPGDSLSIVNGHYRNNNYEGVLGLNAMQERLEQTPDSLLWPWSLPAIPHHERFGWTIRSFGPMYIPRKGDIVKVTPYEATLYNIFLAWETGKPIRCNWDTGEVWAGEMPLKKHRWQHNYYFMAGDNVIDSNDSRYWGLVPEEYIVGVVKRITYSIDPQTGERRKDRQFKKV